MSYEIPTSAWKIPLSGGPKRPGKPRSYPDGLEPSMVLNFEWLRRQRENGDKEDEFPKPLPPTQPMDDGRVLYADSDMAILS